MCTKCNVIFGGVECPRAHPSFRYVAAPGAVVQPASVRSRYEDREIGDGWRDLEGGDDHAARQLADRSMHGQLAAVKREVALLKQLLRLE